MNQDVLLLRLADGLAVMDIVELVLSIMNTEQFLLELLTNEI